MEDEALSIILGIVKSNVDIGKSFESSLNFALTVMKDVGFNTPEDQQKFDTVRSPYYFQRHTALLKTLQLSFWETNEAKREDTRFGQYMVTPSGKKGLQPSVSLATFIKPQLGYNNGIFYNIGFVHRLGVNINSKNEFIDAYVLEHADSKIAEELCLPLAKQSWTNAVNQIEDDATFVTSLSHFMWWYTHATPYVRGSEAIGKWMLNIAITCYAEKYLKDIRLSPNFSFRMPFAMGGVEYEYYFSQRIHILSLEDAIGLWSIV